ncbi:PREDICTED: arf-GAP with dual PH domain-containing protein 2-like isoform X1 [Poecilia mexicana]|uniref:arf-GAP with dual PH domain-containing protein 2-like isoform X1 n=1 Tax=Poecilia mexicana TaxID=48701 RepID=UPI00072E3042|nr:PREDICTED: arf-GAP with dual PH domain-containing protein 2-like isoform X1 [Poecilia mexicana]
MASQSRNNKILLDLVQQPGNNQCADCAAPEPDWASYTLGVFVCLNCSGMHRNLSTVSKVKSIRLDYWEDSLVQFMQERGNSVAKAFFEKCLPAFYYRPQEHDCIVLKEQWIRAKYERREFTGENNDFLQTYNFDLFESTLWKKGRDNKQFLKRIFVLSQKDFTLRYFTKEDSKVAKAVISMKDLNAHFQPQKIGHPHGLQISYLEDERTRNLFVYHENGQVIVSFFTAIRATRLAYLLKKHPTLQHSDLIPQITTHCLKEGYMEKTGPTQREPFKKRWFTLCSVNRKLLYCKSPLDAMDLGAVFIGSQDHGYSVSESSGRCTRSGRWHCGITMETPSRQFVFMCEQEQERREWMEAFRKVISQPMTPEDYASMMMLLQQTPCRTFQIKEAPSLSTLFLVSLQMKPL